MLNYGFDFSNLNSLAGLKNLDAKFLSFLQEHDQLLLEQLVNYRQLGATKLSTLEQADFLIKLAPLLDDFIATLFDISAEINQARSISAEFDPIYEARRQFVQKEALKLYPELGNGLDANIFQQAENYLASKICPNKIGPLTMENLSRAILSWQKEEINFQAELAAAAQYCAFKYHQADLGELYAVPRKIDPAQQLRPHRLQQLTENLQFGFDHRDPVSPLDALMHSKYCLYCHKQGKDSCSKGFAATKVKNIHQREKDGCPLRQKISEMNLLKARGFLIGALAVIIIDNPLLAATGHRICNDCLQSCIFQKQEAVNVPVIETSILEEILNFDWGVEIYLLLTKWNPLNIDSPLPKPASGYHVLVAGAGAAGFAISHYLLNEGHCVTIIDGLAIKPLNFDPHQPIKNWYKLKIDLSCRPAQNFGGIAEYGITNRWDKNNLTLIRLILARRKNFQLQASTRLGSTITPNQALELGFDHIVLCIGAGRPNYLSKAAYFAPTIFSAADFLMQLQQLTPYQRKQPTSLLIRLPALVIGGGLTSVDSAVEIMHYYPSQVANFAQNYQAGKYANLSKEEELIAHEYLDHAKQLAAAKTEREKLALLKKFGGVTILYRRDLRDSPAYRLNTEEIEVALATGVEFLANQEIKEINRDEIGQVESVTLLNQLSIKARTILIATGTENNQFIDLDGLDQTNASIFKNKAQTISHLGDCNPLYAGSIVKALASAKDNYSLISANLARFKPKSTTRPIIASAAKIKAITKLSTDIFSVVIKQKTSCNNYQAGQFYKLQKINPAANFIHKPIAITPVELNEKEHLVKFVIKTNKTNHLLSFLNNDEEVSLMGPIGKALTVPTGKNILFIGQQLGASLLLPLMKKSRIYGNAVNLLAIYQTKENLILSKELQQATNSLVNLFTQEEGILLAKKLEEILKQYNFHHDIDYIYCNAPASLVNILLNLKPIFSKKIEIISNINAAMHCMMKGICGQCVQKLRSAGENSYIFSCNNQYINSESIDLTIMQDRTKQYFRSN